MQRLLSAIALAAVIASGSPAAAAPERDAPRVIKLDRFRKALWTTKITLNGKTGDFLLDTGGGMSFVTEDFSRNLTCKFWGQMTGYNMFGEKGQGPHCDGVQFLAGGTPLSPVNVGRFDFGDRFPGDKAPEGLLALDAFEGEAITLDQTAATLTIETPASLAARIRNAHEVPLRVARDCAGRCLNVFMGVPTKDGLAWMTLDSGAGGVSIINRAVAEAFGLDPKIEQQTLVHEIAPGFVAESPAMVADMIMDGNLGQPVLSRLVITLDLANSRAWLAKS